MRDAIVRYGGVASEGEGEVDRLGIGDVNDAKGSKRFDCAPAAIHAFRYCDVTLSLIYQAIEFPVCAQRTLALGSGLRE
jgi:hypothetical protein